MDTKTTSEFHFLRRKIIVNIKVKLGLKHSCNQGSSIRSMDQFIFL